MTMQHFFLIKLAVTFKALSLAVQLLQEQHNFSHCLLSLQSMYYVICANVIVTCPVSIPSNA